jgi:hypothetical protein
MMTAEQLRYNDWLIPWLKAEPSRRDLNTAERAEAYAAAQLAEKERDIHFWKTEYEVCNELRLAAEQRLQEAQARIEYLEKLKVRAGVR